MLKHNSQRGRRRIRLAFGLTAATAVLVTCAFTAFAIAVTGSRMPDDPRADGIVVLTGAADRIASGLRLLTEGRATRLLITGVGVRTDRAALAGAVDRAARPMLDCCTDIDHAADTIENAAGTRRWAELYGFRSLIVVTSDYHMPRTLAELAMLMPDRELIPYPIGDGARAEASPQMMRLLFAEFLKYLAVRMRQLVETPAAPSSQVHVAKGGGAS